MKKLRIGLSRLSKHNTVYHFSIPDSLINSLYEGGTSFKEIIKHGDFGIGTLNCLDGEMILLDGVAYTIRDDGKAYKVGRNNLSPIAIVTRFKSDKVIEINEPIKYSALTKMLDGILPSNNIFFSIKITGEFKNVLTRTIEKQSKPFPPIKDLINKTVRFTYLDISGTVVGFKSPPYVDRIGVPGYHFHFIDSAKEVGGHLIDFEMKKGKIEIATSHNFQVKVEQNHDFYKLDLTKHDDKILMELEKT